MFRRNLTALLFLGTFLFVFSTANAQDSGKATSSQITLAAMPKGAEMLLQEKIPTEFNQVFDDLLKEGEVKLSGGGREVLAWIGNYKNQTESAKLTRQIQTNFLNANWQYESASSKDGVEFFNLYRESPQKRAVIGFFVQADEVVICALMEVFQANSSKQIPVKNQPISTKTDASAKVVMVDKDTQSVNVMGNEMPPMPQFPALQPKAGKVRGYVKDWSGKPLAGAEIGVRSSYFASSYSGGQDKTDANGYYEITLPKGSAEIYNAGYQIAWGNDVAAISLHPADGKLDSFVTANGAVENFVFLSYGVTSNENLQKNPHLPSTFYGGAINLSWYSAEDDDGNAPPFAVKEGTALEVTLTPEGKMLDGSAGQIIVIRKTLGISGAFRIHNIPLGRYRIKVTANGKPLKIKDNKGSGQSFGMKPVETIGTGSILFIPDQAKASMVTPQFGAWNWIDLRIETL
ncbi:MAG: carboxypeptidase regulatory-like domain-containing protein [Blastocatellia bacterium]|nr:carboxypeptidase regulatory-like domain-containing protein [Blastocatellia bacterium]